MRICTKCRKRKDELDFVFRNKAKNQRVRYCRSCSRNAIRRHYKQYYVDKSRKYRQILIAASRDLIWEHLKSHPCVDCAETDPLVLEFDHVRGQKEFNISTMMRGKMSVSQIQNEMAKCDVRCSNCHKRKTAYAIKSWKTKRLNAPVD